MARKLPVLLALLTAGAFAPSAVAQTQPSTVSIVGLEGGGPAVVDEGATLHRLILKRTGDLTAKLEVVLETIGDPADVNVAPLHLFFEPGQDEVKAGLGLREDNEVEGVEQVTYRLSQPSVGEVTGEPLVVTVHDDDAEFAVSEITVSENAGAVVLPLRRLDAIAPTSVRVGTARGISSVGSTPALALPVEPLELAAGDQAPSISVPLIDDNVHQDTRQIPLEVWEPHSRSSFGAPNPGQRVTVTILDDDPAVPPVVAPTRPSGTPNRPPRVTLSAPSTLRLRRPPTVDLRCDEACVGTAELQLDPAIARRLHVQRIAARARVVQAAGENRTLSFKVDRRTASRLRGRSRVLARVVVVVRDNEGLSRTVRRRVWLSR